MEDIEIESADTLVLADDKKSSSVILDVLQQSERVFEKWEFACARIDDIYSKRRTIDYGEGWNDGWNDGELDLFWASYEILKPAIYARPPKPVVSTQFKDRDPVKSKTAELLERVSVSNFDRSNIDDVMIEVRDDLIFTNRGVMWLTYESKNGDQCVHIEHLDRNDFRHEPARKWSEVGWVARRAWMTRKALKKRFSKSSGDAYMSVNLSNRKERDDVDGANDKSKKGSVWEVWHKADNRVYWVSEGVDVILDEGEPHLKLKDFFPCPRPAYGTLARRTLVPVPDYERYAVHFNKIDSLTARIYLLLDKVKMKGLIPAGGDIGDAVNELIRSDDDELLIGVPAAAMTGTGGQFVAWLPIAELAQAIQGLIEARSRLIDDFYQLSGISDIMRGATESEETLGAQQLKTQFGSVRVRQKIDELQRIAADAVRIAAEIIAENFSKETLIEMAQMKISSKSDIEKQIKGIEKAAEQELKALGDKAKQAAQQMQGQQLPPEAMQQAEQQLQQAQQQIIQKYAPMLQAAQAEVPLDEIMKLLRDDKSRCFAFEIASDSTVMTDEIAEKQSRNEFLTTFAGASQSLMSMAAMGEAGAALAGGMLSFVLGPYRVGRELDGLIDAFIDAAPQMAAQMQGQDGESEGLAEANKALAEAEQMKAQAAMASVQARAAQAEADNDRKMAEMQIKAQKDMAELQQANEKLQLQASKQEQEFAAKMAEMDAKQNLMQAQTAKILAEIGLDVRKQDLEEYRAANEQQRAEVDTALRVESEGRAARGQEFNEAQTMIPQQTDFNQQG